LQHGLKAAGVTEALLTKLGLQLARVKDGHLCCGSAGAYSVMEPEMSAALAERKIEALTADSPETIVTSNIGCQLQLAKNTDLPVRHWISLLDEILA
jgi:glycolate oxidase iron-sulfur subunit